jgi:hypothetical protein
VLITIVSAVMDTTVPVTVAAIETCATATQVSAMAKIASRLDRFISSLLSFQPTRGRLVESRPGD